MKHSNDLWSYEVIYIDKTGKQRTFKHLSSSDNVGAVMVKHTFRGDGIHEERRQSLSVVNEYTSYDNALKAWKRLRKQAGESDSLDDLHGYYLHEATMIPRDTYWFSEYAYGDVTERPSYIEVDVSEWTIEMWRQMSYFSNDYHFLAKHFDEGKHEFKFMMNVGRRYKKQEGMFCETCFLSKEELGLEDVGESDYDEATEKGKINA